MSLIIGILQILTWGMFVFAPGKLCLTGLILFFVVTAINLKVNDESHEVIPLLEGGIGAIAALLHVWMPGALVSNGWALPGGWGFVALIILVLTNLIDQRTAGRGGG